MLSKSKAIGLFVVLFLCSLGIGFANETVKPIFETTSVDRRPYPAKGNINLKQGTLQMWVTVDFDPNAKVASDLPSTKRDGLNQPLCEIRFPDGNWVLFFWNIDHRGMRVVVSEFGKRPYRLLIGSYTAWEKGDKHLLTLSWGKEVAIYVDGNKLISKSCNNGLFNKDKNLDEGEICFAPRDFWIGAVRIYDFPFAALSAKH